MIVQITRLMLLLLLLAVVIATPVIGNQSAPRSLGNSDIIDDGGKTDHRC